MLEKVRSIVHRAKTDVLLTNSVSMMLATGLAAAFGFVFWIIVARSFRSNEVGLATTLLSMSGLVSLLGLAGFDAVFLRFLSKSKKRNEQINSGLIISGLASTLIAGLFCILIPILSPKLQFVDQHPWSVVCFIAVSVLMAWNTLTNAALIAYRRTSFVLAINIIFSVLKICLPFLVRSGGPMAIVAIVGISQLVNVLLSLIVLMKYFDYKPALKINLRVVGYSLRFSMVTYASNVMNLLPDSALPIIVINELGANAAAYFYIAFSIANLIYTISFSTSQVLQAEVAGDEARFALHARKGVVIVSSLLVPAIVLLIIFCPVVLSLFGQNYQEGAVGILRILTFSGVAVMLYSLLNVIFRQTKNFKAIVITTLSNSVITVFLAWALVKPWGLDGVGWAWCIGNVAAIFVGCMFILKPLASWRGRGFVWTE